jgi:hypothetical protein
MINKFLIIAGTEKAGTTSLFQYLVDSGMYFPSFKKETDYLRKQDGISIDEYIEEFDASNHRGCCFLEASPGYLAESKIAVNNVLALGLQNELFVFLLRSPLSRLKSSFQFHKSRFYINESVSFDDYLELCFKYEEGVTPELLGLDEWFLKVPDSGLYYKHLEDYVDAGISNIFIFSFEEFSNFPGRCVSAINDKLGMPSSFYDDYNFGKSNVTAGYSKAWLQRLALLINKKLEGFFYKYPSVKRVLLRFYASINSAEKEKVVVSSVNLAKLFKFYEADVYALRDGGWISPAVATAWMDEFRVEDE